jgi:hypothetical protein
VVFTKTAIKSSFSLERTLFRVYPKNRLRTDSKEVLSSTREHTHTVRDLLIATLTKSWTNTTGSCTAIEVPVRSIHHLQIVTW